MRSLSTVRAEFLAIVTIATIAIAAPASATICIVPDNGGTAVLPPQSPSAGCTDGYLSPNDVHMIIDGLPPGTTIEFAAEHGNFLCQPSGVCSFVVPTVPAGDCSDPPGDGSAGEWECSDSTVTGTMTGTGALAGFNRTINMAVEIETHVQPRTPGEPVQSFDTDMFRLFGQIVNPGSGDPDFDLLRITAGSDFGLPSPGHTTLTRTAGGSWNVDSYFDITYRIDFVGKAGGPLAGMSGSTTGTIRMQAGEPAVFDHLECFKPKDTVKLKAVADMVGPGVYAATGCKLGPAKKYCTPVIKQVTESNVPVVPLQGQNLTNDFICYKMKCPKVALTQGVADQFGTRTLTKLKQQELCVPAQKTP